MKTLREYVDKLLIVCGWLCIWQLASILVSNQILLVGPVETVGALLKNAAKPLFWKKIGMSVYRIALGFFSGFFGGCFLAAVSSKLRILQKILAPFVQMLKAVPLASVIVLILIWWKADFLTGIVSFMVVFPNVYVNIIAGINNTDQKLLEMADVLGMSGWNRFFYLYRNACKPYIESALKISVSMSWKSGVAAEVIGTPDHSIGEALYMAKIYLETADVFAWTIVIIILSYICEKILIFLWKQFCKWEPGCRIKQESNVNKGNYAVEIVNLTKKYGDHTIWNQFCAKYEYGKVYHFGHPSGAGKTTLFRLIANLEKPDNGTIKKASEKIGYCFQENRLLEEYSALRNLTLFTGDVQKSRELLIRLLPENALEKPCKELSGGMKRRVALARAFATGADLIILDEPYTGSDVENIERIQTFIHENRKEKCVLLASHIEKGLSFSETL